MIARQVFYEGGVQGVGFRYSARRVALGFDVAGWVKNLADGRVEMLAAGEPEEVEAFLQAIRDSELSSHIRHEVTHQAPTPPNLRGFEIH